MTKLYLNTNNEFAITSYNRYTDIEGDHIVSVAGASFEDASDYDDLIALMETEITDIEIKVDGTSIYHLANTSAQITSVNEMLDGSVVRMNAQIRFSETASA